MRSVWYLTAAVLAVFFRPAFSAECLPSTLGGAGSQAVVSSNTKGDWAGWWCPGSDVPYIAACPRAVCSLVGSKRAVASWLSGPKVEGLTFGKNPHTDAALRAVWVPERAKLDALK